MTKRTFIKPILLVAVTAVLFFACSDKSDNGPGAVDAASSGRGGGAGPEALPRPGGPSGIGSGGTAATTDSSVGGNTGGTSGIGGTGGSSGEAGSTPFDGGPGDGATPLETGADVPNTGDSGTYQPCPTNGDPCKILPFGDSITWGYADEGNAGYRGPLFALAVANQQKITFTGSLSNGPDTDPASGQIFPKQNEGHSGWNISTPNPSTGAPAGIASLIPHPALDPSSGGIPHIILLMIGTNDTGVSTATVMTSELDTLIGNIIANAPDALLVVAKITPLTWQTDKINAYNASIPGLVQKYVDAGNHVMLADMNTGFVLATMMATDNIHPNHAGYEFMANQWYSVIGSFLPK
jgi:lysophospholipase L1-like esterase